MKPGFIGFAGGTAAGLLIAWVILHQPPARSVPEVERPSHRSAELLADLDASRVALMASQSRIAQLEQQNLDLAVKVQGLLAQVNRQPKPAQKPRPLVAASTNGPAGDAALAEMQAAVRESLILHIEQELERRMVQIHQTMSLTPEQEEIVRANLLEALEEEFGLDAEEESSAVSLPVETNATVEIEQPFSPLEQDETLEELDPEDDDF